MADSEHAVLVIFQYGSTDLTRLFQLEARLEGKIQQANVGEYDGNDMAADGSDGTLYMYGPSADKLFGAIRPVLESTDFTKDAKVRLRYGPPEDGVREIEIGLGT